MKLGNPLMNLGGRLSWVSLVECMDCVGCLHKVFGWFPTRGIRGVVEYFPFDQIEQSSPLVTTIDPAVQDPMDFPLIRVLQLDWRWWVQDSVGDLTRTSGLQQ